MFWVFQGRCWVMSRWINTIYLHSQDRIRQMSENGPTGSSGSLKLWWWDQYKAQSIGDVIFRWLSHPDFKLMWSCLVTEMYIYFHVIYLKCPLRGAFFKKNDYSMTVLVFSHYKFDFLLIKMHTWQENPLAWSWSLFFFVRKNKQKLIYIYRIFKSDIKKKERAHTNISTQSRTPGAK